MDDPLLAKATLPARERNTVTVCAAVLAMQQEDVAMVLGQQVLEDLVGGCGLVASSQVAIQITLVERVSDPLVAEEDAERFGVVRDVGHVGVVVGCELVAFDMIAFAVAFAPEPSDPVVQILDAAVVAHLQRSAIEQIPHGCEADLGVGDVTLNGHLAGEHGQLVHEDDWQVVRRSRDIVDEREHSLGAGGDATGGHHTGVDVPLRHHLLSLGCVPASSSCCTISGAAMVEYSAWSSHERPPWLRVEPIRFG